MGSSTLCRAVARASRLKVWKTKPISLLRMRASWSSSSEPVASLSGRVEASDEVHQGRFAGAGWTHNGDILVVADAQIDAAQGVDLLVTHLVGLPQITGDDNLAWGRTGGVVENGVGGGFYRHRFSGGADS